MRSKRELIEKFIAENLPGVASADAVPQSFEEFMEAERQKALANLSADEGVSQEGLQKLVNDYLFTGRPPLNDQVIGILNEKPKLL